MSEISLRNDFHWLPWAGASCVVCFTPVLLYISHTPPSSTLHPHEGAARMSWTQTSLPTLDHYAFDLRSGLRDAAKKSLQALEENINDLGYAWLDGYMEGIMARAQSK